MSRGPRVPSYATADHPDNMKTDIRSDLTERNTVNSLNTADDVACSKIKISLREECDSDLMIVIDTDVPMSQRHCSWLPVSRRETSRK